jgi:hypothetical protein
MIFSADETADIGSDGAERRSTKIGGLALLEIMPWLAYRRRRIRWHVNGAVTSPIRGW